MPRRGTAPTLGESAQPKAPTGIHTDDLSRIGSALSGLCYPVERWELLDHATRTHGTAEPGQRLDSRAVHLLWTLPHRRYGSLDEVVTALARTVRGHPPRRLDPNRLGR